MNMLHHESGRVGRVGPLKLITKEVEDIACGLVNEINEKYGPELTDSAHPFIPLSFASQVVAGTNYFIKV
jgi:hypothetical protein